MDRGWGGGTDRRERGRPVAAVRPASYSLRRLVLLVLVSTAAVLLTALTRVLLGGAEPDLAPDLGQPVVGDVAVRDPYVAAEGGELYMVSTGPGVPVRRSRDGRRWVVTGRVFPDGLPGWTGDVAPGVTDAWAPTLARFEGRWHLYYAVSTFGTWSSAIGLATSPTLDPGDPDHGWTDHGPVVRSDHAETVDAVGRARDGEAAWNAIDPDVVVDGAGVPWLAWGSFAGGLYLARIDPATGMLRDVDGAHRVASRADPMDGIEASNLVERDGDWYLFSSWGFCCRGVQSTYAVRVGRAADLTGPYRDQHGRSLLDGGGSLVLGSHGDVIGPGHSAVLRDGGDWYLVHHYSDAGAGGRTTLSIRPLLWTGDGWPVAADPGFSVAGDDLDVAAVAGTWEVTGHRGGSGGDPHQSVRLVLREDGRVGGGGTWSVDGGTVTVTVPRVCAGQGRGGERTYTLFADRAATEMHGRTGDGAPVRARRADPADGPAPC